MNKQEDTVETTTAGKDLITAFCNPTNLWFQELEQIRIPMASGIHRAQINTFFINHNNESELF
jgi:hypothetical protein